MRQARKRYLHLRAAALFIQQWYRSQKMTVRKRREYMQMRVSCIKLQAYFRGYLVRKQMRLQNRAAISLLSYFRMRNRAASVIQRAVRHFLLRRRQEKINNSATRIQALWRGYSWRKKNGRTEIKAIQRSLRAVSKNVKENKLYRRTECVLTYKHLSAILEALKHLEVVTRLSPLCCKSMAESGAASTIFNVIRVCNRSVPCMEVVGYAVQVLLNVTKYEKTTSAVYVVKNCVDTLLHLLQVYQQKPGDKVAEKSAGIFTRTCCLLAVLFNTEPFASDVHSRAKVTDHICHLYKCTVPKHKVNTEGLFDKQKKNSCIACPFIPERSVKTRIVSRLNSQRVLRCDNMEEITDSLQAILLVMDTLGIPY